MNVNQNAKDLIRRAAPVAGAAVLAFALGWCWAPAARDGDHATRGGGPSTRPASAPAADDASMEPPEAHAHGEDETVWTCSMHPRIRRSEPGDCPICGMDLVPASSLGGGGDEAAGSDAAATITLSPRARRLAQIETVAVGTGDPEARRRLLGRLEWDETRLRSVTAWVGGRIERLLVAATGVVVRRGQTVAVLYSPEVYASQRDLRVAVRQLESLEDADPSARAAARSAVESSRRRLALLGVPPDAIDRMAASEEPATEVAVRSPVSGTVLERLVTEGQYVKTGDPLYRVADLSKLWVQLDAHESEVGLMDVGDAVELRVPAHPELELEGRVQFVDPTVDPVTRVAQVRIAVDDRGGRLRPGMYVEASVQAKGLGASPLVVPQSAVIFTGRRSVVYVEVPTDERPAYAPRVVEVGALLDDAYVVESGLEPGERVVVEGAFVLDADLQIRGGPSAMSRELTADPHWTHLVKAYVEVQQRLAADTLAPAQQAAEQARAAARQLDDPAALRLEGALDLVVEAEDFEAARLAFEAVSGVLLDLLEARGNPLAVPLRLTYCPMVGGDRGGSWLQTAEDVDNPYFGERMRTCGEVRATIGPGERP